jgi:type IV pilus assembly protein PilQ
MFVLLVAILAAAPPPAQGAAADAATAGAGYLENVTFEKLPGKERVTLTVSRQPGVTFETQAGNSVLLRLENLFVPEGLRRPLSDASLSNVLRVTPVQKTAEGRPWVLATIELRQKAPYSVRQEGTSVLVDFNVASLAAAAADQPAAEPVSAPGQVAAEQKAFSGPRIFLDFQDADIKSVFRLLSEQGKVSIVSGEDVKGPVTIHMKDVPWEQALDTILKIKGLEKKREGNVITVVTLDRKKKEETDRLAAEAAEAKAADERKIREQKQNVEQGKLKQILIEAKIVEVNTNFSRELGIAWGAGYQGRMNDVNYGIGFGSGAEGSLTQIPGAPGIGLTGRNVAVNFPAITAAAVTTPALGLVLGTTNLILDAKLKALEGAGQGKIISSPKVVTLENEKATIWQGKRVPIVTPSSGDSPATVRYEDADLRLIVTPKIGEGQDRISLEIEATNKELADTRVTSVGAGTNPVINTSGVTSKIVVKDGDTLVVGGVYKTAEETGTSGVPFLSQIPVLGWLFKYETKTSQTREILIFITPQIIQRDPPPAAAGQIKS